ncbi:MAG: Rrf2 family transcriptional regulator [Gammaproteobacteria bacterium]|nr:Rrf2 family transcriptional regulator [Gammaproteobacteria bacterium]
MQLTVYTDYSLRVLVYLGLRPDTPVTITEIADSYAISRNHLVKVVHNLGTHRFILTTRGRGGGLILARNPEEINIGDVVRHTELNFDLLECFNMEKNTCPIASVCALKTGLQAAQKAFVDVLDQFSLQDVIQNKKELAALLSVPL